MADRFDDGLYMAAIRTTIGRSYDFLPSTWWNRFIKRRLGAAETPRWAPEVFQVFFVALGATLLLFPAPSSFGAVPAAVSAVLLVRLLDLLVFSLHWVFIARDPVKSHRRSLAAFGVNVFEIPLLYTAASIFAVCEEASTGPWSSYYENTASLLTMRLPAGHRSTLACDLLAHAALFLEAIVLLLALTVVVGMISREEMGA